MVLVGTDARTPQLQLRAVELIRAHLLIWEVCVFVT